MRQVQARAVRQECAEGGGGREGGCKEGGSSRYQGIRRGGQEFPLPTDYLLWWVGGRGGIILGRVSLVIPETADGHRVLFPCLPAQLL